MAVDRASNADGFQMLPLPRHIPPVPSLPHHHPPASPNPTMSYTILGRKVLNEYLAIGTFTAVGLGTWAALRKPAAPAGPGGKPVKPEPKIEAGSKEEEEL
ncbi:hypothetical protein CALVIDRAFT_562089 [Calocera viscosa TUFC12733]|uniref:Uncharacterized protein n=1 Tax=Calocera viscosa (strain TUFC12733) TaxID=1330018 RepID=A0A167PCH0_CALVF|nr:hypothetical protein CALVIDRAFT_562089 [Calocera viscosa TUFC12733]